MNPIDRLLQDPEVSEILVNDYEKIYFEKHGKLHSLGSGFIDRQSYLAVLDKIMERANSTCNRERPFLETDIDHARYSMVYSEIGAGQFLLSVRRNVVSNADLNDLVSESVLNYLRMALAQKKNMLVVGPTSSGKTTLLQALLLELPQNERCIIIEDTDEIRIPNSSSAKLISRPLLSEKLGEVSQHELVKRSLRLRPERLVVGEIRGVEACALLMALSTGHAGSMSSLHARSARQAVLRLEMLIQLGAPQWDIASVRRLISLSLNVIVVLEKIEAVRRVKEIVEIRSAEQNGLLLEPVIF